LFIKAVRCSARIRFYFGFLLKIKDKKEISFELSGMQDPDNPDIWRAEPLTRDHKPESLGEYHILARFDVEVRSSIEFIQVAGSGS
jgi:hypothetical protein